jgi:hypothetical protein
VTVPRSPAPLARAVPSARTKPLASALQESRTALTDLVGELDALLATLRDPTAAPDRGAPDRLRSATAAAGAALARVRRA